MQTALNCCQYATEVFIQPMIKSLCVCVLQLFYSISCVCDTNWVFNWWQKKTKAPEQASVVNDRNEAAQYLITVVAPIIRI